MRQADVLVTFESRAAEDDGILERLARELALDLCEVTVVESVSTPAAAGGKGLGELVVATLAVTTGADPAVITAVVQTVVAFLNRNAGRRATLRIGEVELHVDQPTKDEVVQLIELTRTAVERTATGRPAR